MATFAISNDGALAHLARAFDWQSRGDEFESHMLHKTNKKETFQRMFLFFPPTATKTLINSQTTTK